MKDDRYQFQSRPVKALRWLRYMPGYTLLGVLAALRWWAFDGRIETFKSRDTYRAGHAPPPSRDIPLYDSKWEQFCAIIRLYRAVAGMKMKHYWHAEEVLADLRSKL